MLRVRRIKPTNNFVIVQEMKIKIRNCMKTRMNIEVLPTKDWRLLANCVKLSPSVEFSRTRRRRRSRTRRITEPGPG